MNIKPTLTVMTEQPSGNYWLARETSRVRSLFKHPLTNWKHVFHARKVVTQDGDILTDFQELVVGYYTTGDSLHIRLASGDVVAIPALEG